MGKAAVNKRKPSKIEKFASEVALKEGKKISVSVGNVREIMKIINAKTKGMLYASIKALPIVLLFFFLVNFSFAQTFTPRNYWHFDGVNVGTTIDDSMNVNNLTQNFGGTMTVNTGGLVGKYGTLGSASSMVEVLPDIIALKDSFAIEFLFRPGYKFNDASFFSSGNIRIEFVWPISFVRPYWRFYTQKSNGQTDDMQIVLDGIGAKNLDYYIDGDWHHMVFQYNCATGRKEVWVDGTLPTGFNKTTATGGSFATTSPLYMSLTTNYVKLFGDIDEIAIYTRLLNQNIICQHYHDVINSNVHYTRVYSGATILTATAVTAGVNANDYPPGHTQTTVTWTVPAGSSGPDGEGAGTALSKTWSSGVSVSAINQLKYYPAPRYKLGHTLYPNINVCGLNYAAGQGQQAAVITSPALYTPVSAAAVRTNMVDMSVILCQKFNMSVHIDNLKNPSDFTNTNTQSGIIIKLANDSAHFPLTLGMYRAQFNPLITNQSQAASAYMQNASGQFLDGNGNVTGGTKYSRLSNGTSIYNNDGIGMRTVLSSLITALPNRPATRKVDHIWENGEWYPHLQQAAINNDPVLNAARISSGLDWYTYASRQYAAHAKQSWPDQFLTLPGLQNTRYMEYTLTGHNTFMWKWNETRFVNSPQVDGDYLSTPDYYFRYPFNWRYFVSSDHGIGWASTTRATEIGLGDDFNAPFVCAGWYIDEQKNMRPGQYLGLCKILVGMGAKFFHTAYFGNLGNPFALPENWIWQMVLPNYAQAAISWKQADYYNSKLLVGDFPQDYIANSDSSFLFYTGSLNKITTIRKVNGVEKYLIFTTHSKNSNMDGSSLVDYYTCTTTIPGVGAVTYNTRTQGSVYYFDNTVPAVPIWYPLDAFDEDAHPSNWTDNLYCIAVLNNTTNATIKTEGNTGLDFRDAEAYLQFDDNDTASYTVQRDEDGAAIRYGWIRARSPLGVPAALTLTMGGVSYTIDCITETGWEFYRFDNTASSNVTFNLATTGKYSLVVTANGAIDVSGIYFLESSGDDLNETITTCAGSVTASIDPVGPSALCSSDTPLTLTASAGNSYLWSTGATTQSINVASSGTYTVTVTVIGVGSDDASTVVTVNGTPVISPIANVSNVCPRDSVSLSGITITNTGTAGTKKWYPTLADALASTNPILNDSVGNSGKKYVQIKTGFDCVDIDSVYITINDCSCANPPTVYAGPDQSVCAGSNVTLAASMGGGAVSATWTSLGQGSFSNTTALNATYYPSLTDIAAGFVNLRLDVGDPDGIGPCGAAKDTVRITFNALPSAAITASGATSFCQGGSVGLSVPTAASYLWSTTATTQAITASTNGTYTVTVTSSAGCTKVGTQLVVVNANPTPSITATGAIQCNQGTVLLNSSTHATYLWNTGASTKSITVSDTGYYTITVTSSAGCSGSISYHVIDTCTVFGCSAPYNLTATGIGWWYATINFTAITPDLGFTLYLRNLYTGVTTTANYAVTKRSISLWGLRSRTKYEYYIVARCNTGNYTSVTKTFTTK